MKLALVIDDYLPHSTRVGAKMFHELALELIEQGHRVTVITPETNQSDRLIEDKLDSVNVWRFKSGPIKDIGKVQRAINETLLSLNAWRAIRSKVNNDTFDGVIYYSPSVFFGGLVNRLKVRCACKSYLVLRDLFPQWVIDDGMIKEGSLIARYFQFFERYSYKQADIIGLMSEKNLEVFEHLNGIGYPTSILRNWAALKPHNRLSDSVGIRQRLKLEDKVIYFYGGNIGHAQDMANLMSLAKGMQPYKKAHFLFVGQGDEVNLIKQLATEWSLDNFSYLPSVNQEEFKNILREADVGLFSLAKNHTAHNFPGKLLGYMVQSLPILGSVNYGNDLMTLVNYNKAGFITVNGDDDKLLCNAITLYEDSCLRGIMGSQGYELLRNEFSVSSAVKSILQSLRLV